MPEPIYPRPSIYRGAEPEPMMMVKCTPNGRTMEDAVLETERLLQETWDKVDLELEQSGWLMTRLTKIKEALADRPEF